MNTKKTLCYSLLGIVFLAFIANLALDYWIEKEWREALQKVASNEHLQALLQEVTKETQAITPAAPIKLRSLPLPPPPASRPSTRVVAPPVKTDGMQRQATTTEPEHTQQNKQQIYEKLSTDTLLDIQLALPANRHERERLLDYLYQCAGAELALLNGQEITYLSPKQYSQKSKWLRLVQGQMSNKEQAWARRVNHSGQHVRLFPQAIDMNLSQHISSTLGISKLQSLRGQYSLRGNALVLGSLSLNQKKLPGEWPLFKRVCQ
ncbi:MAG: hypothetical protein ACJAVV_002337 [Alphaproteobacteria bacterium]|jgi:hypothetical protein